MVKLNLEEEEEEEDAASYSLDNSAESGEGNYSNNNCSENRYDWEKKISRSPTLLLDPKPPKFRKRCRQVQRTFPFGSNESRFDQYILSADHKHVFVHPQEGIPVAHPLNHMKILQSKYIHDEFFKSSIVRSGNVIVIPSAQCMYDSIDDIARRIGLREISFSLNPVGQDFSIGHIRSGSASTADMRSFDSARTPAICSQLQVDTKLAINLRKQDSEAKGCPTMTVSSSYLSTSLAHRFVTSAIVYCVWENKLPYFLFIVEDDGGEIFVANAMKVKSSADQTFDYIYVFHAWEVSGKASKKNVTSSPRVVAKMTVSNSLIVSSNRSKFTETEFIMFDAKGKEEHLAGKDKPLSNCNKINRLTKKVSEIFRPSSNLLKQNPKPKDYELDSQFEVLMQTIDESQFLDHCTNNFLPIFELAAIVVRDQRYKSSKEEPCGGWGLKFLEKSPNDAAQLLQSYCPESCRNDDTVIKNGKSLIVLVPSGVHGGPATKTGGPSSLTDRWKSNGVCGCGGWDVGCPLKVLQNDSADLGGESEDCKSLELFIEGGKRSVSEPSFKVVNMSKGVYVVNFDPTLSAPQSFSVAVAFIHSQAPQLCPQL